jgi:isopenicillin-N N-acyltransferase like protein
MLTFTGSAFERGRQHGEARRGAIAERVITAVCEPAGPDGLDRLAAPWERAIRIAAPEVADELRGIAHGSGRSVAEIVLLNAFEAFDLAKQSELGGCTTVAIPMADGAIVAQNWDANPALASTVEVHRHVVDDGFDLVMLASPGGLGWIGMNAAGLALTTTDLLTKGTAHGVPSQVARRMVLARRRVDEAVALFRGLPMVGGRTYALGDAEGSVATVELAAELAEARVAKSTGPALHTNHALESDVAQFESEVLLARVYPSSRSRLDRVLTRSAHESPTSVDDVRELLTDHASQPDSICRHTPTAEPTVTAASAIFDCGNRTAHIAIGQPCGHSFVSVAL